MHIPIERIFVLLAGVAGSAGRNKIKFGVYGPLVNGKEVIPRGCRLVTVGARAIEETPVLSGVKVIADSGSLSQSAFVVAGCYGEGASWSFLPSTSSSITLFFISFPTPTLSSFICWRLVVLTDTLKTFISICVMIVACILSGGFWMLGMPSYSPETMTLNALTGAGVANTLVGSKIAMIFAAQGAEYMRGAHGEIIP